jgi:hypothetical protein
LFNILSKANYLRESSKTYVIENLDDYCKFHYESGYNIDSYDEFFKKRIP